jgi:hypothetical protein
MDEKHTQTRLGALGGVGMAVLFVTLLVARDDAPAWLTVAAFVAMLAGLGGDLLLGWRDGRHSGRHVALFLGVLVGAFALSRLL